MAELGGRDESVVVTIEDLEEVLASALLETDFLSLTLKASRISSSESVSFIFRAIMVRNSGQPRQLAARLESQEKGK